MSKKEVVQYVEFEVSPLLWLFRVKFFKKVKTETNRRNPKPRKK